MITSSAISFDWSRVENKLDGTVASIGETSLGTLPDLLIKSISCDKQCEKIYYPYANNKSIYYPTGMVGPVIKLVCATSNVPAWREVYTNDVLTVKAFGFPTWNTILKVGSEWWVDIKSGDLQSGKVTDTGIRVTYSLDLYRRSV